MQSLQYSGLDASNVAIASIRCALRMRLSDIDRCFPGVGKAVAVAAHQLLYSAPASIGALRSSASDICSAMMGLLAEYEQCEEG